MVKPWAASVFVLCLGVTGCAAHRAAPVEGIKGAPDWVNLGSRTGLDKGTRLFHGLGLAPTMDDPSLQGSVADNRARGEVAFMVNRWLELAAAGYAERNDQASEEATAQLLKGLFQGNRSARIAARWRDKGTGNSWSLAELDLRQLKASLAAAPELPPDLKRYLDENAEALFTRLTGEQMR